MEFDICTKDKIYFLIEHEDKCSICTEINLSQVTRGKNVLEKRSSFFHMNISYIS